MLGLLRSTMPILGRSHLYFKDGSPRYPPQRRLKNGNLAPRGPSYFEIEQNRRIKWFTRCPEISKSLARRLVNNHCQTWQDALDKADDPKYKKVAFSAKTRETIKDRILIEELMDVQDRCPRGGCEVDKLCECIHRYFYGEAGFV